MRARRVLIMGAGGRDFHVFNVLFRGDPGYRVVAFTASQVPGIENRRYPPGLAGDLYPGGIPIVPEERLEELVEEEGVDEVVLAYSDLSLRELGLKVSRVLSTGASFRVVGPRETMLRSVKPVFAVTAVRTGSGKSTVSRRVASELLKRGVEPVVVRHPMAYGELEGKSVQRFREPGDLDKWGATIEEREEIAHYLEMGLVVYSGVDYERVLAECEKEGDVILWDGGNNDWPFFKPDYTVVVADAMRPGAEVDSYPGAVNVSNADLVVINKADRAGAGDIELIKRNVRSLNPGARVSVARSRVGVSDPSVRGKRVLVVEDAPTVTHGGLPYGAGYVAAMEYGCEVVDPRPYAVGSIAEAYRVYKWVGPVLPSLGYTKRQLEDLRETIRRVPADLVLTSSELGGVVGLGKRVVRVRYELEVVEGPSIAEAVDEFLRRVGLGRG